MKCKKLVWTIGKIGIAIGLCSAAIGCSKESSSEYYSTNKLNIIETLLNKSYLYGIETSDQEIEDAIYSSYVNELGNTATYYLDQKSFIPSKISFEGNYFGTGLKLRWDNEESIRVIGIVENSPAQDANITKEDRIIGVDGIKVCKANEEEITRLLGTPTENAVTYIILDGHNNEREIVLQSREVELEDMTFEMIDQVAYIKLEHIKEGTSERISNLLNESKVQQSQGIILDIRGLYTNNIQEVSKVADLFLEKGVAFKLQNKQKEMLTFEMTPGSIDNELVLLTDGYTSSGGEALASALKERAIQIGGDTCGLSYISEMIELEDGSGLCIATGILYDKYTEVLPEKGIEADIRVYMTQEEKLELIKEENVSREKDSTLIKALEQFKD